MKLIFISFIFLCAFIGCDSQYAGYSQTGAELTESGAELTELQRDIIKLCEIVGDILHCAETHTDGFETEDSPCMVGLFYNGVLLNKIDQNLKDQVSKDQMSDVDKAFMFDFIVTGKQGKECMEKARRRGEYQEMRDCRTQGLKRIIEIIDKRPDITCT